MPRVAPLFFLFSLGFAALLDGQLGPGGNEEAAIGHFETLIKQGEFETAKSQLQSFLSDHPSSWRALYQQGFVLFRLHYIGPSLASLSRSLAINEQFAESHKILAFDLNLLGKKDLAVQELRRAIALDPASWESRYELGRLCYEEGAYLDAVHEFERVATAAPRYLKVYPNLGLAYAGIGENGKAVQSFETGLRLNDQQSTPSPWPLIDYATFSNSQNQFEKARDMLLKAIAIDDRWAQEYEELSRADRGLGKLDDAISALSKALNLYGSKAEDHYVLARLYSQAHQPEDAKRELALYEQSRQRPADEKKQTGQQ